MKKCSLLLFAVLSFSAFAKQDIQSSVFKEGDNFCLVGDSITHGGYYTQSLVYYYATRLPKTKINFHNFGVAGDSCGGILNRFDRDIARVKPDVYSLMIGMNDVGRGKFAKHDASLQPKILEARAKYEKLLGEVVGKLCAAAPKVVFFTPSIYDQISASKTQNLKGVNDELFVYGTIVRKYADRTNAPVVDMWGATNAVNEALVQANPQNAVVGADRVHPASAGGYVMAAKFVRDMGEPSLVSDVEIDAASGRVFAKNADVSKLKTDGAVAFECFEYALPLVLSQEQRQVEAIVKFLDSHNSQRLCVKGLKGGKYALKIDGEKVGEFSASDFAKGVDLSKLDTPQARQSKKVRGLCEDFRRASSKTREAFTAELFGGMSLIADHSKRIEKAHEVAAKTKSAYIKRTLESYAKNFSNQKIYDEAALEILGEIYRAAQPVPHAYSVEFLK